MHDGKVLIRYGEIALKSPPVRMEFLESLLDNIKGVLGESFFSVETERGRVFVNTENPGKSAEKISNLPGVVSASPVVEVGADLEDIQEASLRVVREEFPEEGTFAVRARRVGEHDFDSMEIEDRLGNIVLEELPGVEVDLDDPDFTLNVEVRHDSAYVFTRIVDGTGGLPVGSQSCFMAPFEGNDSDLLSCYSLLKRGALPELVTVGIPRTAPESPVEVAEELLRFHPNLRIHDVSMEEIPSLIHREAAEDLSWFLEKRVILMVSEAIAQRLGAYAISFPGDRDYLASVGLDSLRVLEDSVDLPVLYPLSRYKSSEVGKVLEEDLGIKSKGAMKVPELGPPPEDPELMLKRIREFENEVSLTELVESAVENRDILELEV